MHHTDNPTLVKPDLRGPILIGIGLTTVLAAQAWATIPLAAAMAVIGLGATFTLRKRQQHELVIQFNLLIYAAIVSFTIGAQFHAHANFVTLSDAASAIAILLFATTSMASGQR
ncbi:MAG: hypothetical protein SH868_11460 [Bythopirellula sp.]|nr:hypothetical protein [Bythopirellula sp.]